MSSCKIISQSISIPRPLGKKGVSKTFTWPEPFCRLPRSHYLQKISKSDTRAKISASGPAPLQFGYSFVFIPFLYLLFLCFYIFIVFYIIIYYIHLLYTLKCWPRLCSRAYDIKLRHSPMPLRCSLLLPQLLLTSSIITQLLSSVALANRPTHCVSLASREDLHQLHQQQHHTSSMKIVGGVFWLQPPVDYHHLHLSLALANRPTHRVSLEPQGEVHHQSTAVGFFGAHLRATLTLEGE